MSRALLKYYARALNGESITGGELADLLDLGDDYLLKVAIMMFLKNAGGNITADDVAGLLEKFELTSIVSKTKFQAALGSLEYNYKKIKVLRPSEEQMGISDQPIRTYLVKLR